MTCLSHMCKSSLFEKAVTTTHLCSRCRQLAQLEEQKQQLEQYNATIQSEKDNLQLQNDSLTERLEAVVKEKLPSHQFDQDTPVDKTLNLLQMLIMVMRPN